MSGTTSSDRKGRDLMRTRGNERFGIWTKPRLRRVPELRAELETWLHGRGVDALDWEQRKHERLLVA